MSRNASKHYSDAFRQYSETVTNTQNVLTLSESRHYIDAVKKKKDQIAVIFLKEGITIREDSKSHWEAFTSEGIFVPHSLHPSFGNYLLTFFPFVWSM